jgi:DNA primase
MPTDLSLVDLRLAVVEHPHGQDPEFLKCWIKPERSASMAVYSDHLHCFGCGYHEHRIIESLAAVLDIPVSQAFRRARYYVSHRATEQAQALEALHPATSESLSRLLWGSYSRKLGWLRQRGMSDDAIRQFGLGYDGEKFSIPIWDANHRLVNIRFRRDDELGVVGPKYSGMRGRNELRMYPEHHFSSIVGIEWCVVCEGELDAMLLWDRGIAAISPTNGASSVKHAASYLNQYKIKRVYVCTDQDEPGDKAAEEFMSSCSAEYVERIVWSGAKDVTELLQSGGILKLGGDYAS